MRTLSALLLSTAALSSGLPACSTEGTSAAPDAAADGSGPTIDAGSSVDSSADADGASPLESGSSETGASDGGGVDGDAATTGQVLFTTVDPGVVPIAVTINQGTAIGEGALNGATPSTLIERRRRPEQHPDDRQRGPIRSSRRAPCPDTAAGFCDYSRRDADAHLVRHAAPSSRRRADGGPDPMVPMAPFYFPLVYYDDEHADGQRVRRSATHHRPLRLATRRTSTRRSSRPSPTTTARTWYFMQTVLELIPDYTNPISGGYSADVHGHGLPGGDHEHQREHHVRATARTADDGWGHATILQLPGAGNVKTGQFLYLLDRNTNDIPGTTRRSSTTRRCTSSTSPSSTNKFPIWNTNSTGAGANDIKSISERAHQHPRRRRAPSSSQQTVGLLDPDGIMAVFPTAPTAAAGSPVTVLYVQKILNGDDTGATALPDGAAVHARRRSAARPTTTSPTCASRRRPTASTSPTSASSAA